MDFFPKLRIADFELRIKAMRRGMESAIANPQFARVGINPRGEAKKNGLFRMRRKRRAMHDLISPGRTGGELAPAFSQPLVPYAVWERSKEEEKTGCCGFTGPNPQPLWIRYSPNCRR